MPDFGVKEFDYVIKHHMYNINFLVTNKDIPDMLEQSVAINLTTLTHLLNHMFCCILFDNEGH